MQAPIISMTLPLWALAALCGGDLVRPSAAFLPSSPSFHRRPAPAAATTTTVVVPGSRSRGSSLPSRGCSASDRVAAPATRLDLFGNLFGSEKREDDEELGEHDLARISHPLSPSDSPDVKFDSLSILVSEWSALFEGGAKGTGLTTPVTVERIEAREVGSDEVAKIAGARLLFKKSKTGGRSAYRDKDDDGGEDGGSKKEEEPVKEGGVEVRVEQLTGGDLRVVASRCEFEEGTMFKEMSEGAIVDSLRKAVAAWKKEQGS